MGPEFPVVSVLWDSVDPLGQGSLAVCSWIGNGLDCQVSSKSPCHIIGAASKAERLGQTVWA